MTPRIQSEYVDGLPYLTADMPGIGGKLKVKAEDFVVEEVPLYEPSGEGEHLYLWIEKRETSSGFLVDHLASRLAVPRQSIGQAGMKDRFAITRQFISVPASAESRLGQVSTEQIRVVSAIRHSNKLRTGHLLGNRFEIRLRDTAHRSLSRSQQIWEQLELTGVPNFFGPQRFGRQFRTLLDGMRLLTDRRPRRGKRHLTRLALSAVQSYLFNRSLCARLGDESISQVFLGDVMQVRESGGRFVVKNAGQEQLRLSRGETVITGPIFGPKMLCAEHRIAEAEMLVLSDSGLSEDAFGRFPKLTSGTRRPYLVFPSDWSVTQDEGGLLFCFFLPAGSYATVLLRELMKLEPNQLGAKGVHKED